MGAIKVVGHTSPRENILTAIHAPSANTAAVVMLAAASGFSFVLHAIQWSYSEAPTGGRLTITIGGTTAFDVDITSAGPGGFSVFFPGGDNETVVVTLAAGAGTCTGKLNVQYTKESIASR